MVIDSYNVTAQAQRSYLKVEQQTLSVTKWGPGGTTERTDGGQQDGLSLSDWAKEQLAQLKEQNQPALVAGSGTAGGEPTAPTPMSKEELKLRLLDDMLHSLTGKRMGTNLFDLLSPNRGKHGEGSFLGRGRIGLRLMNGGGIAVGSGARISTTTLNYERESMDYRAQGVIKTADGKTINVDVQMSMSREFLEYTNTTMEFGMPQNCVDPLVINYGGTAASLTGEKFAFDLDADGVMDQISFAGAGSGFLALDKNGDGKINDGKELFGPNTGNGFEELRAWDKDKNGWIDENDDVFSQLRIWSKDKDGNDRLFTLQELGIGAIYLGDVSTQFALTDNTNNAQGYMRSTSFFLKENGGAGTISHIDLTV
ncbi:hypothetical protein LJC64_00815 [Ruminococcaceae bacterium OttesenSCG-928-A11]|nr:hypothetical protein [Ruminococcaceae bacterium OttesenSCG-928-A11]